MMSKVTTIMNVHLRIDVAIHIIDNIILTLTYAKDAVLSSIYALSRRVRAIRLGQARTSRV